MKTLAWLALNLVQCILLIAWTVICVVLVVLARPFGAAFALKVPRLWSWLLMRIGLVRFEVEREAAIDWKKAHLFVMNHQSMLDIPAGILAARTPLRFIAKKSLSHVPFLGWYMRAAGMVFVDRTRSATAIASMQKAVDLLQDDSSIIAFPEGTRSRDGRIRPFKKGVFMVALQAGVPIVPMAIEGASQVLPSDGFRPRPGRIRLKIGAPIPTQGLEREDRDELIAKVRGAVIRMHHEIGGLGGEQASEASSDSSEEEPDEAKRIA